MFEKRGRVKRSQEDSNPAQKNTAMRHQPNMQLKSTWRGCQSPYAFRWTTFSRPTRRPRLAFEKSSSSTLESFAVYALPAQNSGRLRQRRSLISRWSDLRWPRWHYQLSSKLGSGAGKHCMQCVFFALFHDTPTPWPIEAEDKISNEPQYHKQSSHRCFIGFVLALATLQSV